MTYASLRAAAQHIARAGNITPHQMASLARLDERLKDHPDILAEFTEGWRAKGSPAEPAGMNVMDRLMPLLDLIAQGEGNYTSVNRGRAGDTPGGYPGLDRLTIGEVQALQRNGYFAVGRYQFIPTTLTLAVAAAGMRASDLFNPEGQDMLAVALLLGGKRPKLRDYLQGGAVSLEDAQLELAKEWASIPMANGRGFYDGDSAGNRASAKVQEVQRALKQARESLAGKTLRQLRLPAQQMPQVRRKILPHLTLARTGRVNGAGLELLELARVVDGITMDKLTVTSGQPDAQVFTTGARSKALSNTPLPEGRWRIGPVEWAGGKGNWNVHWDGPRSGLGPVWIDLIYEAPGRTARSSIGFHLDANEQVAPGSAGCVVLSSRKDVETLIRWLEGGSIDRLYVNWKRGTCPQPKTA